LPIERDVGLTGKSGFADVKIHLAGWSQSTQRLASLYERKLAALAALKKSLLHEAFTGKL